MLNFLRPKKLLESSLIYKATPLRGFSYKGQRLLIKDETQRLGESSFKVLGGAYAVTQLVSKQVGKILTYDDFSKPEVRSVTKHMTFVCASAGNHGLAVTHGAQTVGARSRVHLSKNVPDEFANRLINKGAEVIRSGATYEESIEAAIHDAKESDAIHLADTSWCGYTEIPQLVMEGYTVIAEELREEFERTNAWPTHVYLQAGVGGLAASICFMIRSNWRVQPKIIVVEPDLAPCLSESTKQGKVCSVEGAVSIMGRLDCKTPSLLAFDILFHQADSFVTITEQEALNATKVAQQFSINTTPSGAAGLAALINNLDDDQLPLVIITESDI
ncbi:pyridoxal-phosphate dependent enzyme [Vibrio sp. OCN044]|uniref:Pyridoxal-phosphate dependent enzyme n=1 Tax=Vibrio tetraodonis subsp. pristinus TaxID=2695891 RepID=A0A6L8LRA3_9VIBR|nr:pyridoxal-phosphate dependent enzyme [Vibrio tetraodonis subsp. pristinus]